MSYRLAKFFYQESRLKSDIARKERPNRNTILHLQDTPLVLYHWGLTCSEEISDLEHKGENNMNNTQVYQAQTTNHGIARALGEEIRMITDVEETTYNGHGEITVEYTSDVALTKLFDRIKSLYEKGESYETKPFLHFKVLEDDLESKPEGFTAKEMNFKEFKTWLDDAVSVAEAMALPENKGVLDDLIENTANNLSFIAELVESRQLIYKKPRHED